MQLRVSQSIIARFLLAQFSTRLYQHLLYLFVNNTVIKANANNAFTNFRVPSIAIIKQV